MADNIRPTVTDDHLKKYSEIMGTPIKTSNPNPTPQKDVTDISEGTSLLSKISKPSIGDKMFIFTGRKKIIMDGGEKEVENVKTVDPSKEEAPDKNINHKEDHKDLKHEERKAETTNRKKIPPAIIGVAGLFFVLAWAIFWLVFFGYIRF